jgi:restriction system protein
MELPKFNETFLPILEVLKDGKILKSRELIQIVTEKYYSHLPDELLSLKTKSGDILLENRIAWGKSYLKKGGLVHFPERGQVQITDKGKTINPQNVLLNNLDSNVISFYEPERNHQSLNLQHKEDSSPQDLIESGIEQIENETKNELLKKLKDVDPYYFEKIILILLKKMGYGDFVETSKSNDGGIDGIINEDQLGLEKIYIQAKRYNENKVRETDIRNFIGAMSGDTRKGIFVTTSSFDEKAKQKTKEAHHRIILIDGSKLVDLMHKFNVGVQIKNYYEIKVVDNDFFDTENI